jgi:hypothetical protein
MESRENSNRYRGKVLSLEDISDNSKDSNFAYTLLLELNESKSCPYDYNLITVTYSYNSETEFNLTKNEILKRLDEKSKFNVKVLLDKEFNEEQTSYKGRGTIKFD